MLVELLGRLLDAHVNYTLSNSYFVAPEKVFEVVSNPSDYPKWRIHLEKVYQNEASRNSWTESYGSVSLNMEGKTDSNGSKRFETKSIDMKGFHFEREYLVYQQDKMTFLKIEDNLHFSSPFLRFFSQLFYDHSKFLKEELRNIDRIFS